LFVSVFWPSISLIVPQDYLGIALGFSTSLQNLGLVFFPMIIAYIYTTTLSYEITLLFFIFLLIASVFVSVIIHNEDLKNNNVLNSVQGRIEDETIDEYIKRKNGVPTKILGEIEEEKQKLKIK
jgi:MFS family permease